ncbi:MAG: MMPL family transporter [Gammaproteobacteria bacterium]|jgi:predicted RND superfamily exporter protein
MAFTQRLAGALVSAYESIVLQRPIWTLAGVAIAVALLAAFIPRFQLDASSETLVMEDDEAVRFYRAVRARYESDDFLVVTYTPREGLFVETALARLEAMRDELASLDHVAEVTTLLDVPVLEGLEASLTELPTDAEALTCNGPDRARDCRRLLDSDLYRNLLVSPDGRTSGIRVLLEQDEAYRALQRERDQLRIKDQEEGLTQAEQARLAELNERISTRGAELREEEAITIAAVREVLDRFRDRAEIHLGGVPMIAVDSIAFVRADLVNFGAAVGAFIVLILFVAFRRPRWVILPVVTCAATVVAMMGLLGLLGWPVTVVSSNFISLLLILNLALCVHLVVRYRELHELMPELRQYTLVRDTVRSKFVPCLYTALTTMVAFGSLLVSGIRPVIDFGWMMVIGLGVAFVLSFTFFPAALVLLKPGRAVRLHNLTGELTGAVARAITARPGLTLLVAAALAVAGMTGTARLSIENRFIDYFKKSTEIYQGMRLIDEQLGGTTPLDVLIDAPAAPADEGEEFEEPDFLAGFDDLEVGGDSGIATTSYWLNSARLPEIRRIHRYLESLEGTGKVMSVITAMDMFGALEPRVLTEDFFISVFYQRLPDLVKETLFDPYLSDDGNQLRFSIRVYESAPDLRRNQMLEEIERHLEEDMGYGADNVHLSGMMVLYNNMLQGLFRSQILTLGVVFGAIMIMFLVLFRSVRYSTLGILPNLLSAALVLGLMGWARIPLDLMTVTIAAITIGIGVDNTIHYVHRYREEIQVDGGPWAAVMRCHTSIGQALYYTTITIVLGFSVLALSAFIPTILFGLLTGLAMTAALVANLTLLPVLLAKTERGR